MNTYILFLFSFISVVLGSPARTDCGQTKSFIATNDCGIPYGGTWIACATNMREMPVFTVPKCPPKPALSATSTVDNGHIAITPAPIMPQLAALRVAEANICEPAILCVDLYTVCGGSTSRFGGCYDTCTPSASPTAEPCTLPDPVVTEAPEPVVDKAPLERVQPVDCEPAWMCAPADW